MTCFLWLVLYSSYLAISPSKYKKHKRVHSLVGGVTQSYESRPQSERSRAVRLERPPTACEAGCVWAIENAGDFAAIAGCGSIPVGVVDWVVFCFLFAKRPSMWWWASTTTLLAHTPENETIFFLSGCVSLVLEVLQMRRRRKVMVRVLFECVTKWTGLRIKRLFWLST